ncbi:hco3 transporter family [Apiospora phragmitis]|uniref:Hco3 transporter family n=1 Tax=Apiospora phragmitis TaxID=2905665 RepID=A0ABR1U6Z7_9PEZI
MSDRTTASNATINPPGLPLERESSAKSYTYENEQGWRQYRMLRPCRGMYHDVRRRLPYYWSDITDAFTYRAIASTIRMYFVNLLPAVAYTLDMYRRTGEFFGVTDALFSSALAAMVFSILGVQPLTIVGITGLISLFNYTIYDIISLYDVSLYPSFMAWTGIWAAIFHWAVAIFNLCDYMRYVTDFSSESFGMYVGIIYMIKGVEELVYEFEQKGATAGYLSCIIAILYFASIYALEKLGQSTVWKPWFRGVLADYAYVFATLFWVGFSHMPERLKDANISKVPITEAFHPTQPRGWLLEFWTLPVKWVFVALPFGFLLMLLFYYDHNVSSITAQARQFPLKKPGGFHWDFFLLGCTTFVAAILGLPMPNGLVPQAPVHTDSLTNYTTELKIISTTEGEGNGNTPSDSQGNGGSRATRFPLLDGPCADRYDDRTVAHRFAYHAFCTIRRRFLRGWLGLDRVQQHRPATYLPHVRAPVHPTRRAAAPGAAPRHLALLRPTGPRRRGHGRHLADDRGDRLPGPHHPADPAPDARHAAVVRPRRAGGVGRLHLHERAGAGQLGRRPALPEHSKEGDWGLEHQRSERRFGPH